MNKEKLIDKLEKMKRTAQRLTVETPHDTLDQIQNDISSGYMAGIEEIEMFIQSIPEKKQTSLLFECPICHTKAGLDLAYQEKTNFDVITVSPQTLAFALFNQMQNCMTNCNSLETGICEHNKPNCKNHIADWLKQKAGD